MNKRFGSILFISLLLVMGCSNTKNEYSRLEQLQQSKEQLLQQGYDDNMKIQVCNEVMDSLKVFASKHSSGEWNQKALAAITSWQIRKNRFVRDKDYEALTKVQKASNETQGYTADYDIRIKSCDDAISSIQGFVDKYAQDEATPILTTALNSWKSRKSAYQDELNILYEKAYNLNKSNAINAATRQHSLSNIEEFNLVSRDKDKQGNKIYITDNYYVRMKGRIIGTSIFKFNVKTVSCISMDSKIVEQNGSPSIEE